MLARALRPIVNQLRRGHHTLSLNTLNARKGITTNLHVASAVGPINECLNTLNARKGITTLDHTGLRQFVGEFV